MEPTNPRHPDRMTRRRGPGEHAVYLEVGDKRVFAGAIDWPAWAPPVGMARARPRLGDRRPNTGLDVACLGSAR
jgi:hypothetical protein